MFPNMESWPSNFQITFIDFRHLSLEFICGRVKALNDFNCSSLSEHESQIENQL